MFEWSNCRTFKLIVDVYRIPDIETVSLLCVHGLYCKLITITYNNKDLVRRESPDLSESSFAGGL